MEGISQEINVKIFTFLDMDLWIYVDLWIYEYGFSHLWIFLDALPPQRSSTESQSIVVWACKLSLHG